MCRAQFRLYSPNGKGYKDVRYMLVVPTGGTSWHPDATLDTKEVIPSIVSLLGEPPVTVPDANFGFCESS